MTSKEIENLYIKTDYGIFTPVYVFEKYDMINDTYEGLRILKTSEENYREWLESKNE